jgi:hypothetical protein
LAGKRGTPRDGWRSTRRHRRRLPTVGVSGRMHANLVALIQRVWGPGMVEGGPVAVCTSRPPEGHQIVETYAVIPSSARPKLLLPLGSRAATVGSLLKYNAMKSPTTRARQLALAAAFELLLGPRIFPDRVFVSIDARVPADEHRRWLILPYLSRQLGGSDLHAAVTVRRDNPNVKPTLQLFSRSGAPVGYAKLGWSEATRQLVWGEADALSAVRGRLRVVDAPPLLASGEWRDTAFALLGPLPEGLRRWTTDPVRAPEATLDVAHSTGVHEAPLAASAYARRLRTQLSGMHADAPLETKILREWLERLVGESEVLTFGRWHGDWVAWNLGSAGDKVAAWDWEHSADDVPIGFDVLHWHFQHTLPKSGLEAAVAEVDRVVPDLRRVGVRREAGDLVASLYLLEMFRRSVRLSAGGGGWNPRLHPAMLTVAAGRNR